jgi:Putative glycosyltransferase (DUF6716)
VEFVSHVALRRRIRLERPDVVLLACTGPVVSALAAQRVFRARTRPVLVTGLPGISVPATVRAVTLELRATGQLPQRPSSKTSLWRRVRWRLRLMIPAGMWPHFRRLYGPWYAQRAGDAR